MDTSKIIVATTPGAAQETVQAAADLKTAIAEKYDQEDDNKDDNEEEKEPSSITAEFKVNSKTLKRVLEKVIKGIPSNPAIPILECFLWKSNGITASDLQQSLFHFLEVESDETFTFCPPARQLLNFVRSLEDQELTFTIWDDLKIDIKTNNGTASMAGEDHGDFPRPATKQDKEILNTLSFNESILVKAFKSLQNFISDDEMKPAMNGLCIRLEEDKCNLYTTDSHRLKKVIIKNQNGLSNFFNPEGETINERHDVLIPGKTISLIASLGDEKEINETIDFVCTEESAFIDMGEMLMVSKLINETFPDVENVIPSNSDKTIIVEKTLLINAIKQALIFANKTSTQIKLSAYAANYISIGAEDVDFGSELKTNIISQNRGFEELDLETVFEIGFNGKFLIECLQKTEGKEVTLSLSEPNRAVLITDDDDKEALTLIMPVMLNNYY